MASRQEQILAGLRARFGTAWELWVVPAAVGPPTWCARRHDNHRHVINAASSAELERLLEQED